MGFVIRTSFVIGHFIILPWVVRHSQLPTAILSYRKLWQIPLDMHLVSCFNLQNSQDSLNGIDLQKR